MGSGTWTSASFKSYSMARGYNVSDDGVITNHVSNQEMFAVRKMDSALDPKNVMRECCENEEHPNTIPVILALDVTGSMGNGAVEVAKKLNVIMSDLYTQVNDVEFMIMGIGDLAYDLYPIQVSQFESDIRIAEQLDKVYFEHGGGGNGYESYTAAWYFGVYHTKLDCLKRGRKGIIITMGDEQLNPYLPVKEGRRSYGLNNVLGDHNERDVETKELYDLTVEKFDVYHLSVNDSSTSYRYQNRDNRVDQSFRRYLDENHYKVVSLDSIAQTITDIVISSAKNGGTNRSGAAGNKINLNGEIVW